METLEGFIARHRFRPRDIIPNAALGLTMQHYRLLKLFPREPLFGIVFDKGPSNLRLAFRLAEYMAESATDEPDTFASLVSSVDDDGWAFALKFNPYHKVSTALNNLKLVEAAMYEAGLTLNAAMAGMESAMEIRDLDTRSHQREASKATISLLNYSALYASYVDVCRRLRRYVGLEESPAYNRAVSRIISKNPGEHELIKGLRNFMLHYHLVQPHVVVQYGPERTVGLLLESDSLVRDGFHWTAGARTFLGANRELNLIELTSTVSRDVSRLVDFHFKMVNTRLKEERVAYTWYEYEREKIKHLSRSISNLEAIFRMRSRPVLTKLLDQKVIESILTSSLSDVKVTSILRDLANRHKNLPADIKPAIDKEISELLRKRIRFPVTKGYLSGRPFPRKPKD